MTTQPMTELLGDDALALVVTTPKGRKRRRVYLTLTAAETAAQRARNSGNEASVLLVRLQPVAEIVQ